MFIMTKKEIRKSKILEIIKNWKRIWISEIIKYLSEQWINVDRKSIQRDLAELINAGQINKQWTSKDILYKISDIFGLIEDVDIDQYFSDDDFLSRNVNEIFDFCIFDNLKSINIFTEEEKDYLQNLNLKFIENFSKYDSQTLINKEYERIMIELSRKSSSIEWNTYSLLSTESLIKDNIFDKTKTKEEAQMILNHKDCFNEIIQNKNDFLTLNIRDIEYIHSILIKHLWVTKNIRKAGVGITWTKYVPLDNEFQIREALEKMCNLVNSKEFFFEKALLTLLLLSYIQPFEDWNKRTARMLANAILLANNSIPLSYRVISVDEYKKATILFYEKNNFSYFKKLFIRQVENAVDVFFVWSHNQVINS